MKESCNIIEQCMDKLPSGQFRAEKLPKTLKLSGEVYVRTENPLGMMGYYVVGDGHVEPYRLKMRTPSFSNVSVIPAILPGALVPTSSRSSARSSSWSATSTAEPEDSPTASIRRLALSGEPDLSGARVAGSLSPDRDVAPVSVTSISP